MFGSARVQAKIAIARAKVVVFRLFLWSLGFVTGVSVIYGGSVYTSLVGSFGENGHLVLVNNVKAVSDDSSTITSDSSIEVTHATFTSYSVGDGYTPSTVMASGKKVYVGAAACPRSIAIGTKIDVEGVGVLTCEDRKSLAHDGEFDIYSNSIKDALSFGKKVLGYTIVK